jgi:hypothetical protein
MKLSKQMLRALTLMKEGYELGHSMGFSGSVWLQKGGCGRGGATEKIRFDTFFALRDRQLIAHVGTSYPTDKYGITCEGLAQLPIVL